MRINYNWLAKTLVVLSVGFILSGCFTTMLVKHTDTGRGTLNEWKSDTITGLSQAQDRDGNKGYVFVGNTFDYLLTEGTDNLVKLLNDPKIERRDIEVIGITKFIIKNGRKKFDGQLTLRYMWKSEDVKKTLNSYGFVCADDTCLLELSRLSGTVHRKNINRNYSQQLTFYHPFTIGFYEYKTRGASKGFSEVMTPVTLTLDVITSPLQILGLGIIVLAEEI